MSSNLHLILDKKEVVTSNVASRNAVLGALLSIPGVTNHFLPEFKIIRLSVNQVLYEVGDKVDYVYFPLDSVVSSLAIMEDGTTMETAMVGREGFVGISTVLETGRAIQFVWATISGNAIQLDARFLDKLVVQNEDALKILLHCYRARITQTSQRCVCNTRHSILERLCCWLLMIHDRVGGENLKLTQEMIASRVGARRAGITVAAGLLQEMKAIEYKRGQLHISNRSIIEETVCECYSIIKKELPPPRGRVESILRPRCKKIIAWWEAGC